MVPSNLGTGTGTLATANIFLYTSAPQATLYGLPGDILLTVMSLLDVHSLISLSRVCRRFHDLHSDTCIWSDIDLTDSSLRARLDAQKLKKIIHTYLPSSLWRIKLSSNSPSKKIIHTSPPPTKNAPSTSSKNPILTESLLDDLFIQCPRIKIIVLNKCDLTGVRSKLNMQLFSLSSPSLLPVPALSLSLSFSLSHSHSHTH